MTELTLQHTIGLTRRSVCQICVRASSCLPRTIAYHKVLRFFVVLRDYPPASTLLSDERVFW